MSQEAAKLQGQYFHVAGESAYTRVFESRWTTGDGMETGLASSEGAGATPLLDVAGGG